MAEQMTWLITGCSGGLGEGIAQAALKRNQKVIVTARNLAKLSGLTRDYPQTALARVLDVTDRGAAADLLRWAEETCGGVDVLVNNAGHGYRSAVEEGVEAQVTELFETNFFGPVRLIKEVLPGMRRRGCGTIVNISSIGAVSAGTGSGYYAASKAALELLSDSLIREVAPCGIRVMIVEPGAMRTDFFEGSMQGSSRPIDAYAQVMQGRRKGDTVSYEGIRGDPALCGEVIVETVLSGQMPQRLLLGSDAVDLVRKMLTKRIAELETWKDQSIRTDMPRSQQTSAQQR